MVPGSENGTQLLPFVGAAAPHIGNLPTPREAPASTLGMPHSSLDFLADISAHHGRTEPDVNAMALDEQQHCFGWAEVTDQAAQRNRMDLDNAPNANDLLQIWLEPRIDTESDYGSLEFMRDSHFSFMNENVVVSPDPQNRRLVDSGRHGSENIPNERFSKVQRCWFAPPNHTGRLMNNLWRDIVHTDVDNLFSIALFQLPSDSGLLQGSRCGIDEDCRRRFQAAFGQSFTYQPTQVLRNEAATPATTASAAALFPDFPPAEILDMALDLFFRTFHPLVPFVHLPTFSAKKTRLPLLYTMCLIGMMLLGTKGTTTFVSMNFTVSHCTESPPAANTDIFPSTCLRRSPQIWRDVPWESRRHRRQCPSLRQPSCSSI